MLTSRGAMLWTRVEPEYARHDALEVVRYRDFAFPAAICSLGVMIDLHVCRKGREQVAKRSLQHDRPFRRATMHDHEVVTLRELLNLVEVCLACSVLCFQLLVRKIFPLGQRGAGQLIGLLGQAFGSPAERTRTVTLAISDLS